MVAPLLQQPVDIAVVAFGYDHNTVLQIFAVVVLWKESCRGMRCVPKWTCIYICGAATEPSIRFDALFNWKSTYRPQTSANARLFFSVVFAKWQHHIWFSGSFSYLTVVKNHLILSWIGCCNTNHHQTLITFKLKNLAKSACNCLCKNFPASKSPHK